MSLLQTIVHFTSLLPIPCSNTLCSSVFDCLFGRGNANRSIQFINAMYEWYRCSARCYIYLSDFEIPVHEKQPRTEDGIKTWYSEVWPTTRTRFRASSWFTRGWTLQELMAPERSKTFFLDAKWTRIGSLGDLLEDVVDITGIQRPILSVGGVRHYDASVAQIMSWASQRKTSRGEDSAYCLLGLFDVNMPLLYGEGRAKAFYRLQIEIMQRSDDESLFAWTSKRPVSGALAYSPACFADSKNIFKGRNRMNRRPYSMTNKGLEFSVPSYLLRGVSLDPTRPSGFMARLDCFRRIDDSELGTKRTVGEKRPVALHLLGRVVGDRIVACRKPCNTLEGPEDLTLDMLDKVLLRGELRTIYIE